MPINAYVGWPGSGKSYQVVSNVIIPQIAKGRSIVTNIDGIKVDAIYEYVLSHNPGKIVCLGSLRLITNEDIESPLLFPREFTDSEWKKYQATKSWQIFLSTRKEANLPPVTEFVPIIKPGEMIIVDEAVNWWGQDCTILPEHGRFFREHRHHVDPYTHESCDLILIAQEISDIKRSLRALVQYTFRTEKLDTVGLDKRYKLHMFRGAKVGDRTKPLRSEIGQYKPEIYACYDSYGGGKGKEKSIDGRHNVLSDKKLKYKAIIFIIASLLLSIFAYTQLKNMFGDKPVKEQASKSGSSSSVVLPSNVSPSNALSKHPSSPVTNNSVKVLGSSGWRVVGKYMKRGFPVFVLMDGDGVITYYSPFPASRPSSQIQLTIDGVNLNSWSNSNLNSKGAFK